jgi:hypothetical protein
MTDMNDFKDEIDWSVYNKQNNITNDNKSSSSKSSNNSNSISDNNETTDSKIGHQSTKPDMVNTFIGDIPRDHKNMFNNPEAMNEILQMVSGSPGMKIASEVGPIAKNVISKGMDYLNPGKEAEKFRSTLGEGTSSENIGELGKRAQLAKQSTKEEALIPKTELYNQEGKSDIYNVNPKQLPEGNIEQTGSMFDDGGKFSETQNSALSKALREYRKTGNIESFVERGEDIFNVRELTPKHIEKIEDALEMPTKRESRYFSDKDVASVYSPKGKLMELHNLYEEKPILNNYDNLQSALKKEIRLMENRAKVSDTAQPKIDQLKSNIKNLNKDKNDFMETLPENMRNLEDVFRQKYRKYAETYEKGNKETGASLTLRRLAEGRHSLVDDAAVVRLFSKPTAADKAAILDMGPSAARNAIYSALQRVNPGDAENMANTILDLKRTKGFDKIIDQDMESWANKMLTHVKRADMIKRIMASTGGALTGSAIFGPFGGAVGAAAPFAPKAVQYVSKFIRK